MRIFTSYWGGYRGSGKVGISRFPPRWVRERVPSYMALAPGASWMRAPRSEYQVHFARLLARLDAGRVHRELQALGDASSGLVVLLCFEKPPFTESNWCHRRLVAEWLQRELGIEVPEWGLSHGLARSGQGSLV